LILEFTVGQLQLSCLYVYTVGLLLGFKVGLSQKKPLENLLCFFSLVSTWVSQLW